jgi:hypothetical protein
MIQTLVLLCESLFTKERERELLEARYEKKNTVNDNTTHEWE